MNFAAILREMGRNFGADEGVLKMCYFQSSADGVVVGDGNEIHAPFTRYPVEIFGGCVTLRDTEFAHGPVGWFVGVARVNM